MSNYYYVDQITYNSPYKYDIITTSRNNSNTSVSKNCAISYYEKQLNDELALYLDNLCELRQKMIDFQAWKEITYER